MNHVKITIFYYADQPSPCSAILHAMAISKPKTFTALLEGGNSPLNWVIARVPFDIDKAWPTRNRLRIRGNINGFAFRSSLFPFPGGPGYMVLVNKKMQAGADARRGDKVRITIEPDLEERKAVMPPELAAVLKSDRQLRKWFESLSEYTRRMLCGMVDELKSPEARRRQADRLAERMMLTMEAELETPPILRAAFVRQPLAETGWNLLTARQRRSHLFGIFYYESVEARERRLSKAIEDALQAARKASGKRKSAP